MTESCNHADVDDLDRRIVAALHTDGRATWREVARRAGSSESTVARRAQRLIDDGVLRVSAVTDPLRCGLGAPVLVQLKCAVGAAERVAQRLAERPDVRFVANVTGVVDVIAELIVPSRQRLARFLLEELRDIDGIVDTTTASVLRNFKTSYDWSWALLGDREPVAPPIAERSSGPRILAPEDLELISVLVEDGRRSIAELASTLGMSESMARRRLDALTRDGFIRFATLVDPQLLGYEVEAFVWLRVDLARLETIAATLAGQGAVRYLSATTGFSDLTAELVLGSRDDLYAFCTTTLAAVPGIRQVDIGVELETIKRAYLPLRNHRWRSDEHTAWH
jgi:DNA-binding Lrp family transcriptional regulator